MDNIILQKDNKTKRVLMAFSALNENFLKYHHHDELNILQILQTEFSKDIKLRIKVRN